MSRPAAHSDASAASPPLPFVTIPLVKVNGATGEFWAKAALEVPDTGSEIFDYASSKPHFRALIDRTLKESGGKKEAPLRIMHDALRPREAGLVLKHHFDDERREVSIYGKITDQDALAKALDGTLCGISMEGKKRHLGYDSMYPGCRRYTAIPFAHSLVDLGAIPGTQLEMMNAAGGLEVVQADGSIAHRLYKSSYADDLPAGEAPASLAHLVDTADHHARHAAKHGQGVVETVQKIADVMAAVSPAAGEALHDVRGRRGKDEGMQNAARTDEVTAADKRRAEKEYGDVQYADPENKKYPIDTAAHIRAAWNYINKATNAAKYADKGRAVRRKIIAAWKKSIDAAGPPSAMEKAVVGAVLANNVGFDLTARVAQIVGELAYLAECQEEEERKEGDAEAAALCAQFDRAIRALGDTLVAMTAEEVDELAGGDEEDGAALPMANAADALRGMRGRVQRMHNMAVEMGAACAPPMENGARATTAAASEEETAMPMTEQERKDMAKAVAAEILGTGAESPLAKAIGATLGLEQADGRLAKAIGAAVAPAFEELKKATGERLAEFGKRLKAVEDAPEPGKGVLLSLDKAAEGVAERAAREESALKVLADTNPLEFVKLMQRQPGAGFRVTREGISELSRT